MPRLSAQQRETRERDAQARWWAFLEFTRAPLELTPKQMAEIERFETMTDQELTAYYNSPEGKAEIAQHDQDEANSKPLIHGKRRARPNKKAFDLQLRVYDLHTQGLGVRAIARKLNRRASTIQRALQSIEVFAELREKDTYEQHVLYRCPQCRSGKLCKVGKRLSQRHDFTSSKSSKNVETCAYESIYPFICDACGGAIFSPRQAIEQHRKCADKLLSEAA